jgi:hypothetical protein
MAEACQGFFGATRDGEGVIWDETRCYVGHRLEGARGENGGYYSALSGDDVMFHVMDEESLAAVWLKLESRYMSNSLTNKLYQK